jgi:hypothetical protein
VRHTNRKRKAADNHPIQIDEQQSDNIWQTPAPQPKLSAFEAMPQLPSNNSELQLDYQWSCAGNQALAEPSANFDLSLPNVSASALTDYAICAMAQEFTAEDIQSMDRQLQEIDAALDTSLNNVSAVAPVDDDLMSMFQRLDAEIQSIYSELESAAILPQNTSVRSTVPCDTVSNPNISPMHGSRASSDAIWSTGLGQ